MSIRSWMQASLLLLSIGLLVGVHAQSSTAGNITGTVRDPQGAAVPRAEVMIVEERTGAERKVTANEDGFYSVPSLPAGVYTISTSPAGFKKTVATGIQLHVSENLTVNLDVQVGQVTETVTITSEQTAVELRSGEVSSLISEKQVTELPLNGRNYAQLALMVPGVSPVTQAGAYMIQAGSFTSETDAVRQQQVLGRLGIQAAVQRVAIDADVRHRVRIGPISDLAKLNAVRGQLRTADIEILLSRLPD